ncbi:MAG: hypothetical protein JXD22_11550 [Sedimentisphaerales bacterium]|nr:hypothetical protein [Sedimentisphaerales bacterium]
MDDNKFNTEMLKVDEALLIGKSEGPIKALIMLTRLRFTVFDLRSSSHKSTYNDYVIFLTSIISGLLSDELLDEFRQYGPRRARDIAYHLKLQAKDFRTEIMYRATETTLIKMANRRLHIVDESEACEAGSKKEKVECNV